MDYMVRQPSELRSESMANNTSFAMIWKKKTKNSEQGTASKRPRGRKELVGSKLKNKRKTKYLKCL